MASSSSQGNVAKSKELGRYREGAGGGRPQNGESRTVTTDDVKVARKCVVCDNQMNKAKIPVVCSCKEEIYCSEDCQLSSSHNCHGRGESFQDDFSKIFHKCSVRYQVELNLNRGPSSEKIEQLMKRSDGDQEHMLVLAEAGDPVAAYLAGEAYVFRKVTGKGFRMPQKYLDKSFSESNEIGIKWLKIAAEGGIPEGMFLLFMQLNEGYDLITDKRLAHQWLAEAYGTGKMDYLLELLESNWTGLPREFNGWYSIVVGREARVFSLLSPTLSNLLLAARWQEIRDWDGKTAMGEPFFGRVSFKALMETFGSDLEKNDARMSSLAYAKKKGLIVAFVSGRPGCSEVTNQVVSKKRNENNIKLQQGIKTEFNPDYQLITQATQNGAFLPIEGRTLYLVSCHHNEASMEGAKLQKKSTGVIMASLVKKSYGLSAWERSLDKFQVAGECEHCRQDALQRLKAVANGHYSISINEIIPQYGHAARYVKEDGVIVQDIFKAYYSKIDLRQVLQCLMSNPADLHPAAMAEDQNLYWPIVWYWGSVFHAIQDTCNRNTLEAIYQSLGDNNTLSRSADASALAGADASALAAFPDSAAGEWRIGCGSEDCPRVDHEVKFNLCRGCKARRYCNEECQRNDWTKHKKFCKAAKVGSEGDQGATAKVGPR